MTAVRRPAVVLVTGGLVAALLVTAVPPAPPPADAPAPGTRTASASTVAMPRATERPPPVVAVGRWAGGVRPRPGEVAGVQQVAAGAARSAELGRSVGTPPSASAARSAGTTRSAGAARSTGGQRSRRAFSIAVTGDVLLHTPVIAAARRGNGTYDFTPLLAGIRRPIADADLALCHLEVPLTRDRTAVSGYPVFNAPAQVAEALAAVGYDGCSVASNHAFDQGMAGIRATLRALDRAGLRHAGTARSRREARRTTVHRVGGARVAHLSYTYGLNGVPPPAGRRWAVRLIDPGRILDDARRARRRGADLVVVSLHWGDEYVSAPTASQRRLANRLLRSRAVDVLVGHHAHVVQPVDRRGGKVVVYGLGNLLSNQSSACCPAATQDGVIVRLRVRERRDGRLVVRDVEYLPTIVRRPDRRVVVVGDALRRGATGRWKAQLRASRRRTRQAIGDEATLVR